jgi:rhodanese-related sulfurtransferase
MPARCACIFRTDAAIVDDAATHPLASTDPNMKSASELFAEARQRTTQVSPEEVRDVIGRGDEIALIDVREPNEWNLGHLPGAVHLPRGVLESSIESRVPRDRRVILYCASGNRSALAAESLKLMGYESVASLSSGFRGWAEMGGDIEG